LGSVSDVHISRPPRDVILCSVQFQSINLWRNIFF